MVQTEKKTPINYAPRPGLINAPASASLPAPLDTSAGDESGYFPQDQEAVRKRLLRESKSRNPVVRRNALAELKRRYKPESGATNYYEAGESRTEKLRSTSRNFQADGNDHNPELSRRQRDLYLKQKAEVAGARGAAPRKYLTEPPREYRTPAETAEVGIVGEKEKTEAEKNRKPLIDFSRERGIFGKKKS